MARPAKPVYDLLASCEANPSRPPGWVCPRHFDLRGLLGMPVMEAEARAREHGLRVRVVERDGHGLILERDRLTNRVNVAVQGGVVTALRSVG